jgi:hypothetical protein
LAVTTASRSEALPDIPTVGEFVPGFEASTVYGVGAPKNTPPEIIDKLNKEINELSPTRRSRRGSPTWARRCFRVGRIGVVGQKRRSRPRRHGQPK